MTQTFLPYPNFKKTARVLDNKRLNSTINEGYEAYCYNLGNPSNRPLRHPHGHCVNRLWKGYEHTLRRYLTTLKKEAISRGLKPMNTEWFISLEPEHNKQPPWLGINIFHTLYKRHLLYKDPLYYTKYFKRQYPTLGYIAPSKENPTQYKVYSSQYDKEEEEKFVSEFSLHCVSS